jgi:hypothetical protein
LSRNAGWPHTYPNFHKRMPSDGCGGATVLLSFDNA